MGKYRDFTLAFAVSNMGASFSFGLRRVILFSRCPIESSLEAVLGLPALSPPSPRPGAIVFSLGRPYGTNSVIAAASKSTSWMTVSPPFRSLVLSRPSFSSALTNFFAVFQLVFLICNVATSSALKIGKNGKTWLEISSDCGIGNSRP